MNQDIMDSLFDRCKNSELIFRARVSAAVVQKNKIISIASNSKKTHPLMKKYCKHPGAVHLHAEISAIVQAVNTGHTDFSKSEIYIARARADDPKKRSTLNFKLGNARPCPGCMAAITAFGFSKIHYSLDDSEYETLKVA